MEKASNVGLARLITFCARESSLSLLVLEKSSETDCGHHIGDEVPLLGYSFETRSVSDVVDTRATKRPKLGRSVFLNGPDR